MVLRSVDAQLCVRPRTLLHRGRPWLHSAGGAMIAPTGGAASPTKSVIRARVAVVLAARRNAGVCESGYVVFKAGADTQFIPGLV